MLCEQREFSVLSPVLISAGRLGVNRTVKNCLDDCGSFCNLAV